MSRWIDANEMIKVLAFFLDNMGITLFGRSGKDLASSIVFQADKGKDVVEVIRCRECKYCSKDRIKWSVKDEDGNWIDTKCNLCRRTKLEVNLDDFCSYGERSE